MRANAAALCALLFCASCEGAAILGGGAGFAPRYGTVETTLLAEDLVSLTVTMEGARGAGDLRDFTDCAASQFALIRGANFLRHVRTNLGEEGRARTADAAYTISRERPRGDRTLDAAATVAACRAAGIPTV
ncbi:MAG: hypothetical protein AAFP13_02075 [Pseudomonadota bacterium]